MKENPYKDYARDNAPLRLVEPEQEDFKWYFFSDGHRGKVTVKLCDNRDPTHERIICTKELSLYEMGSLHEALTEALWYHVRGLPK